MKNEKGFTLIEMMVVLLVISILLIITIPNVTKSNSTINQKGCEAFTKMVEAQVQAYKMDNGAYPASVTDLADGGYLDSGQTSCPNGDSINIGTNGEVSTNAVQE